MPNGKPGDHPYTDIFVHRLTLVGGGVDEEIFELVGRFPEAEGEVRAFVEDRKFRQILAEINARQSEIRAEISTIWNAHMSRELKERGF
jgi:hypothetical protein